MNRYNSFNSWDKDAWLQRRNKWKLYGAISLIAMLFQAWPGIPLPIPIQYLFGQAGNMFVAAIFLATGLFYSYLGWSLPSDKEVLDSCGGNTKGITTRDLIQSFDISTSKADQVIHNLIKEGIISLSEVAEQYQGWVTSQLLQRVFLLSNDTAEKILMDGFFAGNLNITNKVTSDIDVSAWACKYVGVSGVEFDKPDVNRNLQMDLEEFTAENKDIKVSDINRALLAGDMNVTDNDFAF